jgi:MFS family permease
MGGLFWTPTYFERVHGWSPLKTGALYGGSLATIGVLGVLCGALVSEWMDRRGFKDTNMRLPMFALVFGGIPGFIGYFMPVGEWSLALIVVTTFLGSFATAPLMAALQLVTPNEMRGQVMAIFAVFAGIVGPAFGPMIIAFFTDYVYRNDAMIGWSLITTWLICKPIVLILFIWSLKPYRIGLQEANERGLTLLPVRISH